MTRHRYGLISDTHGHVHPDVHEAFKGVEAILHAGDVVGEDVLDELEIIAPVHAVHGNCDMASHRLPPVREVGLAFGPAIVTHSHLHATGRELCGDLARIFEAKHPRLILYGHTHIARRERHGDTWVVNPGPAGKPRFRDTPQIVVLTWDAQTDEFVFQDIPLDWAPYRARR